MATMSMGGTEPRQNCFKKTGGGAGDTYGYLLYNCEVSRDWRFQPLQKQGEMQLEEASFRDK